MYNSKTRKKEKKGKKGKKDDKGKKATLRQSQPVFLFTTKCQKGKDQKFRRVRFRGTDMAGSAVTTNT
jgi:hypothetical protein